MSILPLRLENLHFEAAGRTLISGITLEIENEALTMIVGPNGAGKSLLLRLCHGLLAPSTGRVTWAGPDAARTRERQAMVFQRPVVLNRSVEGNIEYPLKLRGMARKERRARARDAMERTGITHLAERPAQVLSGGEQQKLALARAWTTEPDVLFLDEPTASLDPKSTLDVERLIADFHASGIKIVMTSHNLGQLRRLADDVIFLADGRVRERAETLAFLSGPRTAEAQAYLADELAV